MKDSELSGSKHSKNAICS